MTASLWSTPFVANTTTASNQIRPDIALLTDGRFIVSWMDQSTADVRIMGQMFNPDGSRSGGEMILVEDAGRSHANPVLVALPNGRFAVGYADRDTVSPVNYVVRVTSFEADGTAIQTRSVWFSSGLNEPQPHLSFSNSVLYLTSDRTTIGTNDIQLARFGVETDGRIDNLLGLTFVNPATAGTEAHPHSAVLNNGNIVVAYHDSTESDVEFVILDPVGGLVVAADVDMDVASSLDSYVEVEALTNGAFVVVYVDEDGFPGDGDRDLYYSIFAPDGTLFRPDQLITSNVDDGAFTPTVVPMADGFAIFWLSNANNSGGTDATQVRGRIFDNLGNPLGFEFPVGGHNNASSVLLDSIDAVMLADGRIAVTWDDTEGDGSFAAVQVQIVDPRFPAGQVNGTNRDDVQYGNAGVDNIHGRTGNDEMYGLDGNDIMLGGRGTDTLYGGNGDDVMEGGDAADELYGGAGFDIASYTSSTEGVIVTIGGSGVGGDAQGDILRDIEGIRGSQGNDDLRGSSVGDHLWGESGNDTLQGNGGNDTLFGGAGNDVFLGGAGGDWFFGGEGNDRVSYFDQTADLLITMGGSAQGGTATGDALRGIEWITSGSGNDEIRGDDADNLFFGQNGNDLLFGGGGNDDLRGGIGNDVLVGGAGADTLRGNDGAADRVSYSTSNVGISISLANDMAATGGDAEGDVFETIERVTGSTAGDYIRGDNLGNVLDGFTGNDTLNGGAGSDLLIGGAGTDEFEFFTAFGQDRIFDFQDGVEQVDVTAVVGATAGSLAVTLAGSGNVLATFNGIDTIEFIGITNVAQITAADFIFA